jgi:hypothetical protein
VRPVLDAVNITCPAIDVPPVEASIGVKRR